MLPKVLSEVVATRTSEELLIEIASSYASFLILNV